MPTTIIGKKVDLDGFQVTRVLPNPDKTMVGPFIFFDHMGPAEFKPGDGIDVRPHPHIGLATITYMLEGSLLHRDSLGNNLEILPGDVNWMTAGRGIVHSERETIEVKSKPHKLDGLQAWLALPEAYAEIEPSFTHIKKCQLPHRIKEGVMMRLIVGDALGMTSPIKTYSPMFYLDVTAQKGRSFERPNPDHECMLYVIDGSIMIGDTTYEPGDAVLLDDDRLVAQSNSRCLLLGGEKWEQTPHKYWNFVSFSRDRIEQAKEDWRAQRFPLIPGDDQEFTPLPD